MQYLNLCGLFRSAAETVSEFVSFSVRIFLKLLNSVFF